MKIIGSLALLGLAALGYKYRAEIKSEVKGLQNRVTDNIHSSEAFKKPTFGNKAWKQKSSMMDADSFHKSA